MPATKDTLTGYPQGDAGDLPAMSGVFASHFVEQARSIDGTMSLEVEEEVEDGVVRDQYIFDTQQIADVEALEEPGQFEVVLTEEIHSKNGLLTPKKVIPVSLLVLSGIFGGMYYHRHLVKSNYRQSKRRDPGQMS